MIDPLSAPSLAGHDLACERGDRLLFRHLSFTLSRAQLLLVQGGNGQGKTSLLRLLTGLGPAGRGRGALGRGAYRALP
jgi:heme exporter protein A